MAKKFATFQYFVFVGCKQMLKIELQHLSTLKFVNKIANFNIKKNRNQISILLMDN